ncbi:MAG: HNH endonuclease [Symploca sp. SIO2B6]|nr:HNH endonuclease [Symploca sp. SIO2B6]
MNEQLRQQVIRRADQRCEYCHIPQAHDVLPFQIDHIIAIKHHGSSDVSNLALACFNCNSFKGPNIAGIDQTSQTVTRLFHPRQDQWHDHFIWNDAVLNGRTSIGEVTIDVLSINLPERMDLRRYLMALNVDFS